MLGEDIAFELHGLKLLTVVKHNTCADGFAMKTYPKNNYP